MRFDHPLVQGTFLRREKRFFVYSRLDDGRQVVAHTNNTGRMSGCLAPGARIWLSPADHPTRKLKWTLELAETVADPEAGIPGGQLVGVNTARANKLVAEALTRGTLPPLAGYATLRPEVSVGPGKSRIDFHLSGHIRRPDCWVEVKNVTLVSDGQARFPDAPSDRGRKHLEELAQRVSAGDRAALVFCIQRSDACAVGPADDIDPAYGQMLRLVMNQGVEVYGALCEVRPEEVSIQGLVPINT